MKIDPTERKALVASAFVASLMLMPLGGRVTTLQGLLRDRIPALGALGLALLLFVWHVWRTRAEEAEAPPKLPRPPEPQPAMAAGPGAASAHAEEPSSVAQGDEAPNQGAGG